MHPVSDLASLLSLEKVKPDANLGAGPVLGWGGIYGGQVIAPALRAAGLTVGVHVASLAQEVLARERRAETGFPIKFTVRDQVARV